MSEPALTETQAFSARTVIWLVVIGVFALCGLVVLSAYAPDLRDGSENPDGHALSRSGVGFAGAARLLRLSGRPVTVSRGELPMGQTRGLLIATPTISQTSSKATELDFAGPVLIVLPKWQVAQMPLKPTWVRKLGTVPTKALDEQFVRNFAARSRIARQAGSARPTVRFTDQPAGAALKLGPVDRLQSLSGPGWLPVLMDGEGRVLMARQASGKFYVLADPDLLNTQGLSNPQTARTALAMVDRLRDGGPVIFDATLHGFGRKRDPLRLALQPPLLGATLAALAAALLLGFAAAARFGPTRKAGRALALGKRSLVDNTAALVRMVRREHRFAPSYADLTREAVARAVGAPRELEGEALTGLLDRLGASAGAADNYSDLEAAARSARNPAEALLAAQRLHQWRLETAREHD